MGVTKAAGVAIGALPPPRWKGVVVGTGSKAMSDGR